MCVLCLYLCGNEDDSKAEEIYGILLSLLLLFSLLLLLLLIFRLVVKISAIDFSCALDSICCILTGGVWTRVCEITSTTMTMAMAMTIMTIASRTAFPSTPSSVLPPFSITLSILSSHYENLALSSSGQIHLHYYKNDYYFCLPRLKRPPTAHSLTHSAAHTHTHSQMA